MLCYALLSGACVCVLLSAGSAAVADVVCCAPRRRFIQNIFFPALCWAAEVELKIHAMTELSLVPENIRLLMCIIKASQAHQYIM